MNDMSNKLINAGLYLFGSALGPAVGAVALAHPIGAVGGAILGVSNLACVLISQELIELKETDSRMLASAKIVAMMSISIFGGLKLAAAFGVNMSLTSAVIIPYTTKLEGLCY